MSDYRWLEQLHREHHAKLLRLARNQLYRSCGCANDAEDIVQEAFLLAAKKDIRHHEAPLKWLIKTTSNLCKRQRDSAHREQKKQQRIIQVKTDHSDDRSVYALERQESKIDMQETLITLEQTLTDDDWELFKDIYLQGQSYEEAAASIGISVNALRVRLHRIRVKTKEIFNGM